MLEISIAPEVVTTIAGFPVTNTILVMGVIFLITIVIAIIVKRRISVHKPATGVAGIMEFFVEVFLDFIDSITSDHRKSIRIFPIVATIFLIVLLSNLVELVPGLGSIGIWEFHGGETILVPFIRSMSADLNFTLVVAVFAMASVQVMGMRFLKVGPYLGKFFVAPWKKPFLIGTFVGLLEFMSEFSKILSFTFRLFGNIFAGEVLLAVMGFLSPFLAPLPFLFLELFVGFVQALVFATLTIVFLSMATTAHDHEEEHAPRADYSHATFGGKPGGVAAMNGQAPQS
ncbi:MAG: F0F1 ATP synthase subunit A [Patescibacteria group bacterium]|nr:F0F1 ATP synthase subunit A [Patescibacteria group bacterium]